jgi:hypothetical protein
MKSRDIIKLIISIGVPLQWVERGAGDHTCYFNVVYHAEQALVHSSELDIRARLNNLIHLNGLGVVLSMAITQK